MKINIIKNYLWVTLRFLELLQLLCSQSYLLTPHQLLTQLTQMGGQQSTEVKEDELDRQERVCKSSCARRVREFELDMGRPLVSREWPDKLRSCQRHCE